MGILKDAPAATGLEQSTIDEIRRSMPTSPFKKVIAYDLEYALQSRMANAPDTIEKIWKEEGIREGLRIALGILEKKK
jgi:hypothetical protein